MSSNETDVELVAGSNVAGFVSSYDDDGFTVSRGVTGSSEPDRSTHKTGDNYVAWSWKAGTSFEAESGVSDSGSKNPTAGFSIATWTGDDVDDSGITQTIAHGLGVVPEMIIAKGRTDNNSAGSYWFVYNKDLPSNYYLLLDSDDGGGDAYLDVIENITDSSADFGTDSSNLFFNYGGDTTMPTDADTYVAYFFASVDSYSKVGSFSGSSTAFVYTGFRPSFILAKRSDESSTGNWLMFDDRREGYNVDNDDLKANSSAVEATTDHIDILSNGFKIRTSDSDLNTGTVIYYAVGQPLKYANAR